MDDVLELLAGTGPEYGGGDTNHGPMAAESLCFLGREEMAIRWAENYKLSKLEPHISARQRILSNEWKEYLGRRNYFDGWKSLFHHEIESSGWKDTLRCWIPRFLPGIVSAAAHGALRTAHAVRSLEKKETTLRKDELCSGLGYWAATFQTLPEAPYSKQKLEASEAIEALYLIPIDKREVCLRLNHANVNPIYKFAAEDAISRFDKIQASLTRKEHMVCSFSYCCYINGGHGIQLWNSWLPRLDYQHYVCHNVFDSYRFLLLILIDQEEDFYKLISKQ